MSEVAPVSRYRIAEFGALLADPARVAILLALMDGSARPAGELARQARVAAATASAHLARLVAAGLLAVRPQGRHRYFRLADDDAAHLIETLVAARGIRSESSLPPTRNGTAALRNARTCYRHLAGHLGVALFDALLRHELMAATSDGLRLSTEGVVRLRALELLQSDDEPVMVRLRGRVCLDWTERRNHLGGRLGGALCERLLTRGWLRVCPSSRALTVPGLGRERLRNLGVE